MEIPKRMATAASQVPRVAVAIVAAVALALVGVGYASADTPGVTINVTPSTGLADSQSVSVSGTGFAPQASVSIFECKPGACALIGTTTSDANGDVAATNVTVNRTFTAEQGAVGLTDCAPEDNCFVYATDSTNRDDSQSISFASAATTTTTSTTVPTVNPVLTANPNTGLANTDTVTASGTGFTPQASVTLSQCKLANGTPQSCAPIGSALTDANGDFSTDVTVTRNFQATQGAVQGPVDCGPEDTCVIDATDAGNAQDNAPISFASIVNATEPTITVDPTSFTAPSGTASVSGTGFAASASVTIQECKLNGGGTQSCQTIGTTTTDGNGDFGPTTVTVDETFTATQGITGTTSCLPDNDCVVYAIDSINNDDAQGITFTEAPTTTSSSTTSSTTSSSTTSSTTSSTSTTVPPTTTTTIPRQSAACNALLSARASFNASIDALEATFPALWSVLEPVRAAGNAAFSFALRLNNCTSDFFTPAGAASDARVMRRVLPRSVQTQLAQLQSGLPTTVSTPASTAPATYIVQPGDTLTRIAQRVLGSASQVVRLIQANPWLPNPNLIRPGQVLTIPG